MTLRKKGIAPTCWPIQNPFHTEVPSILVGLVDIVVIARCDFDRVTFKTECLTRCGLLPADGS